MGDWTAGYVTDIQYTYGYYPELNPLNARFAMISQGVLPPKVINACELGFGQGLSVNIHGAASGVNWYGTDFNPAQAGFARELAEKSGNGARLYEDSFAEFAARTDLPDFEFIALHGIWSWISEENRAILIDFIRRKLKAGGVLYVSYNTMPGWSGFAPIRHLLAQHAKVLGVQGDGVVKNINGAIDFVSKLMEANPLYRAAASAAMNRLDKLQSSDRHYLAHEYFNENWHPLYFSQVAEQLSAAKLQYACSANLIDHVDALNLRPEHQEFMRGIPDPVFRETVRDYMVNQQFRRDYWVKGARQMSEAEKVSALCQTRIVLRTHRSSVSLKVRGMIGEADMNAGIYNPILDLLANYRPHSLAELENALSGSHRLSQILQAVVVLAGTGHVSIAADEDEIESRMATSRKLNEIIWDKSRNGLKVVYNASPVIGGAIALNAIQMIFCEAIRAGLESPVDWANHTLGVFVRNRQNLMKENRKITDPEELKAELMERARNFAEKQLPVLRALRVL